MASTITVVGAVFSSDSAVLAFRRANAKSAGGKWEFPGGKVEPGELPEEALRREIFEELGVHIAVGDFIDRTATAVGTNVIDLACYHVTSDTVPTNSTDHDDIRWQPLENIYELDWAEPDYPVIRALVGEPR